METKGSIRKEVFARRKAASEELICAASDAITARITALSEFQQAEYFFAYMDFKKEVMTRKMIEAAWDQGKKVAVPKVEGSSMTYYEIKSFSELCPGYFGIPEPEGAPVCPAEKGFLLVPGVAFDRMRHRIGYGKGFYDRYLAAHPGFVTAAVAFSFQVFEEVPFEETDILPQMLVTEQAVYR